MKTILLIILTVFLFSACEERPNTPDPKNVLVLDNGDNVRLLFEHDGCKVYKFQVEGNYGYYTSCEGKVTWSENCGKNCRRDVTITTNHK